MEYSSLTPDSTFPYRLFRYAHKRSLDSVSVSYFAIVSKDNTPVGLVLLVDIDEQWHHARSAATSFWQIFVREFNHSESRSTLTRFEAGLKELNKAVVKTQEKVHQPISVAAAVFEGNQIHFSSIGSSRVILIRSGQLNDVTAGSDKSGNQFAAVTSGDITGSDIVVLSNQNFYEFAAAEPEQLWQTGDGAELSKELLSRAQNSQDALNCIVIQYDPDNPSQTTLYWEESEKLYPIALPKVSLPSLPKPTFGKIRLPKISLEKFSNIARGLGPSARQVSSKLKGLKPARLVVAGIIIAVLSTGIFIWQRGGNDNGQSQVPIVSAAEQLNATETGKTVDYFFDYVANGQLAAASADELSALSAAASQRGIELLSPVVASELPNQISGISTADKRLFIVDQTGQLWEFGGSQLKQVDHQYKPSQPVSLVAFSADSLLVSDNLGNIWHYSGSSDGPVALALPSALGGKDKLIGKFGTNLYVYSREQNAVYRQTNFSKEITTSNPYFGLSAIGNAKLVSWAINGNFMVFTEGNTLIGVLRNEKTSPEVAVAYADSRSRVAGDSENMTIVSSRQLLSAYGSSGKLLWQKFLLTEQPIDDVAIAGSTLWIASGKNIYKLTL